MMNIGVQKDSLYEQSRYALRMMRLQRSFERKNQLMGEKRYQRESMYEQNNIIEQQMEKMKHQLNYRSLKDKSKASPHLRLYVLEQDRSLKKLKIGAVGETEEHPDLRIDLSPIQPKGNLEIPDIKELFKNQKVEWMMNQNKKMREHINTNLQSLKSTLKAIGATEVTRKLPSIVKSEDDQRLSSRRLIKSLQRQKQQITESLNGSLESKSHNTSTHVNINIFAGEKPPKQKIRLQGVKPMTINEKTESKEMLPSTYMLYQFKNIAQLKQKKQRELSSLLKNSYLNRQDILNDKIKFYSKETQYYDLSPNSQMHLRFIMKKKLEHRLDLSKRQVELFLDLIREIKDSHTLIEQGLVNLMAEIRDELVNGRTIRKKDFQGLLRKHKFNKEEAETKHILNKLKYMMF